MEFPKSILDSSLNSMQFISFQRVHEAKMSVDLADRQVEQRRSDDRALALKRLVEERLPGTESTETEALQVRAQLDCSTGLLRVQGDHEVRIALRRAAHAQVGDQCFEGERVQRDRTSSPSKHELAGTALEIDHAKRADVCRTEAVESDKRCDDAQDRISLRV